MFHNAVKNALRLMSTELRSVQPPSRVRTLSPIFYPMSRLATDWRKRVRTVNGKWIPWVSDIEKSEIRLPTIAINGLGRIGKCVLQLALNENLNLVAINQPGIKVEEIVHFLTYNTLYGGYTGSVSENDGSLLIDYNMVRVFTEKDFEKIKWNEVPVDYVIDTTAKCTEVAEVKKHMAAGVKKVIISDPSEDVPMFVRGVNFDKYKNDMNVVSSASCATNCAATLLHTINEKFGVEHCVLTTVHASESSQKNLYEVPNMCNTTRRFEYPYRENRTMDIAKAVGIVIPALEGKVTSYTIEMPVMDVSLLKLCIRVKHPVKLSELKSPELWESDVISYTEDKSESFNYIGSYYSATVDFNQVSVLIDKFVTIGAWYDIDRGHSNRLLNLYKYMVQVDTEKAARNKV